jgi:hypothetical protein
MDAAVSVPASQSLLLCIGYTFPDERNQQAISVQGVVNQIISFFLEASGVRITDR